MSPGQVADDVPHKRQNLENAGNDGEQCRSESQREIDGQEQSREIDGSKRESLAGE